MILFSKFPKVFYRLPKHYTLQIGIFPIYSLDGKKMLVDKEAILPYEISYKEAQQYLYKDLNQSISQFIEVVKSKTGQASTKNEEETDYLDSKNLSAKVKEGSAFLGDMADAIKVMWDTTKSDDESIVEQSKEKMKVIRERLKVKGVNVPENFDEIPAKMREKYSNTDKAYDFKKSASMFEEELSKLKKGLIHLFKPKENKE